MDCGLKRDLLQYEVLFCFKDFTFIVSLESLHPYKCMINKVISNEISTLR